jgi:hypothetical protein
MLALTQLAQGFAIAHLTLLVFFLIGSVAFPWCDWETDLTRASRVMSRVTCTCGLGLAIAGLALFALGLAGWLTVPGISIALVVLFVAGCTAWRNSPLRASFWQARLRALSRCWNWPLAFVYLLLLLIGSRALIPDATGYSDAIYYHLAYAQDWANAGRLVVDPFLFFAFYANNFVLLYAGWIVLGAGSVVQFLTWTTGLLLALALYAAIDDNAESVAPGWRISIGLLLVLAVISSPIFLDYAVLGYIDVPIGTMAFLAVVAIRLAIRDRQPQWLVASAVMAAFLVGMKASFILLAPIFAVALIWGCLAIGARKRFIVGILAILCAVSAPWYVRNLVLSGDPIAPSLNLTLYGQDGLWKAPEWEGVWSDVQTSKSPGAFLKLPARAYIDPEGADFREYGASGLILFLYVPTIAALGLLLFRRRIGAEDGILVFVLSAFILYWFVTSSLLRYALLLYPILALCLANLLFVSIRRWPRYAPAALALAVVAALPSFAGAGTIKDFTRNDVLGDFHQLTHYRGGEAYLDENDDGYSESRVAAKWMHAHGYAGNVYVVSDNAFDYYFRRDGITSIGSWIGPAGYFRLLQALDAGEAAEFLASLDTRAVLLSSQRLIDAGLGHLLAEQLEAAGYSRITLPETSNYQLYVRGRP